jgi:DNA modification methylase
MNASRIITGDCRDALGTLPDQSIHCCITSPPYFGLRDYGIDGQIGLEQTPEAFVAEMVTVFREVRRVLRDDGTLWLNLGDSYNAYNANRGASTSISDGTAGRDHPKHRQGLTAATLKNKDLVGIPWRVAFALQADGWYLRQDIIWHKPNPMPEGVEDRCTKAHEYIFLLSKKPKYYYDQDAISEPLAYPNEKRRPIGSKGAWEIDGRERGENGGGKPYDGYPTRKNKRSVWMVNAKGYKGAHFATFPTELVLPCVLAGCPAGGTVLDPFNGAGTTGLVALSNGRNYCGIELNPEYVEITKQRLGLLSQTVEFMECTNAS